MWRAALLTVSLTPALASGQNPDLFIPDTTVSGFLLCDSTSALSLFGRIHYDELIDLGPPGGLPRVHFKNATGKEVLSLYFHPGTYENQYPEVRISMDSSETIRAALPIDHFSSGRGVRLGLTSAEIIERFGRSGSGALDADKNVALSYSITGPSPSSFLERFNYPSYYAHFTFEQDRLIDYRFGFEYP